MSRITLAEDKIVENQLEQAKAALLAPNFRLAQRYLLTLLETQSAIEDVAEEIRKLVRDCSEQMLPNWDLAEQTLTMLDLLDLKDTKSQEWQYGLKLQMAREHLKNADDIDYAMTLFAEIKSEPEWHEFHRQIDQDIALIFRETISDWISLNEWEKALQLVRTIYERWPVHDDLYDWLGVFAAVLKRATDTTYEVKRYRTISQSISLIFVIAVILYAIVLIF